MANKPLKSIKFPGLNDTYIIPQVDSTLAVSGAAADAKKTGDAIGDLKSAVTDLEENATVKNITSGATVTVTSADDIYDIVLHGPETSLYDGMAVIDGVNIKVTSTNGQGESDNRFMVGAGQIGKAYGNDFKTSWLSANITIGNESANGRNNSDAIELSVAKTRCEYTVAAANAYLAEHPLIIWFKTDNFASAQAFYPVLSATGSNAYRAIGTMSAVAPLEAVDTLSFATGKITRSGANISTVTISEPLSAIPDGASITSTGSIDLVLFSKTQDAIDDIQEDISNIQGDKNSTKVEYSNNGFINTNGILSPNDNYRTTNFIPCDQKTVIILDGVWTGDSSFAYAFYTSNYEETYIQNSGQNNVQGHLVVTSVPSNAKFVRLCSRVSTGEVPVGIVLNYLDSLQKINDLQESINNKLTIVTPKNTTFFKGINYFDPNETVFYSDRFCDSNGRIISSSSAKSISFPVDPSTHYILYAPDTNRGIIVESSENNFSIGKTLTPIYTGGSKANYRFDFTTGPNAKYVFVYINSGEYDYDSKKSFFILNKDEYTGDITPFIGNEYLSADVANPLSGKQILIFGDSITDTCNFTINAQDQTTAVTWKNPSNSYTPVGGTTIYYSMWPKILRDSQGFAEIRNYARSGASYKTSERTSGEERQNLQYQITVALNDRNNPNDVFEIDNFVPDIVIFALGTNDGTPNDTFESAMSKTVLEEDGYTIDVEATLAALDDAKFCESARKAFLRIKQAFPLAQMYCALPIQRANNDTNWGTLREYLSQMAQRYGCVIIDSTAESGITREFNVWNEVGEYLKDGLHPNDKGQNLLARTILTSLKTHYVPFGTGFNPMN